MRYGAGLRDRLRRLEEAARGQTMILVCPECGAQFVAHCDVPMEFIVHEWVRETGEKGHHDTPEGPDGALAREFRKGRLKRRRERNEALHRVAAQVHGRRACMIGLPGEGQGLGADPDDGLHHSQNLTGRVEHGALLDMSLDIG